jgi:4-carboxymuconolactone decarboxylase
MLGRESGVTEEQLRALPRFRESEAFSPLERLVLEYAAAMTRTPAEIPDGLFAALRERLEEAALVELTSAIAWENYRARFNHAFGLGPQGFSEGAFCPAPEAAMVSAREAGG